MKIVYACNMFLEIMKLSAPARSKKERGFSCVKADDPQNASHLDKFPINKLSEAKQAMNRMNEMTKAPKWWKGSLDELKELIKGKISEKFTIETSGDKIIVKNR